MSATDDCRRLIAGWRNDLESNIGTERQVVLAKLERADAPYECDWTTITIPSTHSRMILTFDDTGHLTRCEQQDT